MMMMMMIGASRMHPQLYEQFSKGNHTIHCMPKFWAGLSANLVIEQKLMNAVKERGGLTRGQGLMNSVCIPWLEY